MNEIPIEIIGPVIAQLGIGSIFLWLYLKERSERIDSISKKDEVHEKVLDAFKENTKVTEQMKATIASNTESNKRLSDLVYDVLKDGKK